MGVVLLSDARWGRVHRGAPEAIVIRIAITVEAYKAIVATMPLGSVGYEPELDARGKRYVWLPPLSSTGSAPCAVRFARMAERLPNRSAGPVVATS
jgi:hypothetical protein